MTPTASSRPPQIFADMGVQRDMDIVAFSYDFLLLLLLLLPSLPSLSPYEEPPWIRISVSTALVWTLAVIRQRSRDPEPKGTKMMAWKVQDTGRTWEV
ncbi:hypothetical protein LZ31DRAFT_242895 [Colletotrichum somersetense]|nr:hypothetical protein LZ31DRAFT_242895 [Colletotrichum somersetense]